MKLIVIPVRDWTQEIYDFDKYVTSNGKDSYPTELPKDILYIIEQDESWNYYVRYFKL